MLDLDIRSNRFEKEKQKRLDEAKRKRAREQRIAKEQKEREEKLAEEAFFRRKELERIEMERQLHEQEELRLTGGVSFTHILQPYKIDGEDDKVILPEDCLTELSNQDAIGKGALMFRLQILNPAMVKGARIKPLLRSQADVTSTADMDITSDHNNDAPFESSDGRLTSMGVVTHCGVREFSSNAGSIGLPRKVLDTLFENTISNSGSHENSNIAEESLAVTKIQIKYVLLPKCTFAKLQPKYHRFFDVIPVKLMLEENLRFHSTLSMGDILTVWYRGIAHELVVVDMKPEPHCSLIDTDVEVDLDNSEELIAQQQEQQQQQRPQQRSSTTRTSNSGTDIHNTVFKGSTSVGKTDEGLNAGATAGVGTRLGGMRTLPLPSLSTVPSPAIAPAGVQLSYSTELLPEPALHIEHASVNPESDVTSDAIVNPPSVTMKLKFPTGATKVRRFSLHYPVGQLFLFAAMELKLSETEICSRLQLSSRFPPRAFKLHSISTSSNPTTTTTTSSSSSSSSSNAAVTLVQAEQTLAEVGFCVGNETLFVNAV